jgi:hypothetical protein
MFASVKARVIRLTRLDELGRAVGGSCGTVTSGGFIAIDISPEYEQGEVRIVRNIWGQRCENYRESDELIRATLRVSLCGIDPALVAMLAEGCSSISDDLGKSIGIRLHSGRTDFPRYALEVWTKQVGGDCEPDAWLHWSFPRVRAGAMEQFTLERGPTTISVAASAEGAGSGWGWGPYFPAPGTAPADPDDVMVVTVAAEAPPIPVDGCGYLAIDQRAETEASPDAPVRWVSVIAPGNPDPGDEFLILPEQYVARWNGTDWVAVTPLDDNLAATPPAPAPPPAPVPELEVVNV